MSYSLTMMDINLNINLYDDNFDDCDPKTTNHVKTFGLVYRYEQHKACKKKIYEELLPVAWHPTRQWVWCMSQDEEKEVESFLIDEK